MIAEKIYNQGYQKCLDDIRQHFLHIIDEMEGDDYAYIASHNINQELLQHIINDNLTPELIANALIYRH